jgi:cellulose synthase/poly-beta-1,6-N-acetylglucosamine synthase-like glycosyltransferase
MQFWPFVFVVCTALVFHTYVLFPWQMKRQARKLSAFDPPSHWPEIDILMAAYNEAEVIAEKVHSVFKSDYPAAKVRLWVGSDASTDGTDAILERLSTQYPHLHWQRFEARTGKPAIINQLAQKASAEILVITDADAMFATTMLAKLVAPFSKPKVGGVQANTRILTVAGDAVAAQEASYTAREMEIKAGEGLWGAVIGGFGSAYAVRRQLFRKVPAGFIVDDFYTFADISRQGYETVFQPEAMTELRVSADAAVQFRRKRRIGKGNYQNLLHFTDLLNPFTRLGYTFWSHKALRWLTPWLILLAYAAASISAGQSILMFLAFTGMSALFVLAIIDLMLQQLGISLSWLRFLGHFLRMNLALLLGFFDSLGNSKAVYWNNKK